MIKVLHIVTRLDEGGLADTVIKLCEGLQQKGFHIVCIAGATHYPHPEYLAAKDRKKLKIIKIKQLIRSISPVNDFISLYKLLKIIKHEKPDIVHTHSSKAGILGRLAAAILSVPVIIHSPHGHIFYGYFSRVVTLIFMIIERLLAKITYRVTTLTNLGLEDHVKLRIAEKKKFCVLPCGIQWPIVKPDAEKILSLKKEFGINREKVVGWVGRLVPIKNCELLLKAAQIRLENKKYDIKYLIIGDGEERVNLENFVKKANLGNSVRFLGNRNDIINLMHIFDLFVLTSNNEGLGRVILEAMSCGIPVIATKVGGVPEIITDKKNGLLIPPNSPVRLSNTINRLLANYNEAKEFGKKGIETAQYYSFDNMINRTAELYKASYSLL